MRHFILAALAIVGVLALLGSVSPTTACVAVLIIATVGFVLRNSVLCARLDNPTNVAQFIAPTGGVVAGTLYLIGAKLVFATETVAQTLPFTGIFRNHIVRAAPKTTGEAWAVGQALYWVAGTSKLSTTKSTNALACVAIGVAASDAETGDIQLVDQLCIADAT